MILRRLSQSLKEQNWTAIWIEFVLLVAGVFLGIQAANWNAVRADDVRAQAYLVRIHGNLQADLLSIDRREAFWRQVLAYGRDAVRYAETGELAKGSAWKTVLAFYQASQLWPWATTDTTYQELRSSGELNLLRDDRLRDDLATYYLEGSGPEVAYVLALNPEYRKIVRGLTPQVVSDRVWSKCWRQANYYEQTLFDCDSPMTETQAQQVLDAYLTDPRLLSELRFWVTTQGTALSMIGNNRRAVTAMLARLPAQAAP